MGFLTLAGDGGSLPPQQLSCLEFLMIFYWEGCVNGLHKSIHGLLFREISFKHAEEGESFSLEREKFQTGRGGKRVVCQRLIRPVNI